MKNFLLILLNYMLINPKQLFLKLKEKYIKSSFINQLLKYSIVSILGYLFLFLATYLLVENVRLSPSISYFIAASLAYLWFFGASIKFIFRVDFKKARVTKFLAAILLFWFFK